MNHVTFETAVRLKEAGFPQPEFSAGQFWIYQTQVYVILEANSDVIRFATVTNERLATTGVQESNIHGRLYSDEVFFAPTATDIMRALPGISLRWHSFHRVWQTRYKRNENRQAHENPAEACALVWLRLL